MAFFKVNLLFQLSLCQVVMFRNCDRSMLVSFDYSEQFKSFIGTWCEHSWLPHLLQELTHPLLLYHQHNTIIMIGYLEDPICLKQMLPQHLKTFECLLIIKSWNEVPFVRVQHDFNLTFNHGFDHTSMLFLALLIVNELRNQRLHAELRWQLYVVFKVVELAGSHVRVIRVWN